MRTHLFLKGSSGAGKTTLLLECIRPYLADIGGFLSQRLIDEQGETKGFCLVPIAEARTPQRLFDHSISNIFIEKTEDGWHKYPEIFAAAGLQFLAEAETKRLCVLDEIGGVELLSPIFKEALYKRLASDGPCLGVIKNFGNLAAMSSRVPMKVDSVSERDELENSIKNAGGSVLEFSRDTAAATRTVINDYLEAIWKTGQETRK